MISTKGTITFLDLFAGAGGLSEGFLMAGYKPLAHVEMNPHACDTLRTREGYYHLKAAGKESVYTDYLLGKISRGEFYAEIPEEILSSVICETMSDDSMPSIFDRIDVSMAEKGETNINVILGGPPCQAYSAVGRARKNMAGDPRNDLYRLYFQALEKYEPDMFVFENVPGLYTAAGGDHLSNILDGFQMRGYDFEDHILDASDYNVLQNRKRVIIVGWKKQSGHSYPEMRKCAHCHTVSELFDDLPPLAPGEQKNEYLRDPTPYLIESGIRKNNDILTWHVSRPNLERDRQIYRLAIRMWNRDGKRLKYTDLPEELATHKNRSSFLDRFKVVAADLPVSQTMVAHISKDGHYYIHPDIKQARSISVREAARIQSFPDNFYFEGSRTEAFRQIGNAVPPLLAKAVAEGLHEQDWGE